MENSIDAKDTKNGKEQSAVVYALRGTNPPSSALLALVTQLHINLNS